MSTVAPWLDNYRPRRWAIEKVEVDSNDHPSLSEAPIPGLCICDSMSQRAQSCWQLEQSLGVGHEHLYWNLEQEGAFYSTEDSLEEPDFGTIYGGTGPYVLSSPWRGYEVGAMVIQTYRGIKPPLTGSGLGYFTYLVEGSQPRPA